MPKDKEPTKSAEKQESKKKSKGPYKPRKPHNQPVEPGELDWQDLRAVANAATAAGTSYGKFVARMQRRGK